jgi:hypothetical protein
MKGNERKCAFISFHFLFGIEPFQWVAGDSNEKNLFALGSRLDCARRPQTAFFPFLLPAADGGSISVKQNNVTHNYEFRHTIPHEAI